MALTVPVAEIVESSKNPLLGKHESWGRVLLGDIATIQNGFPFKSSQFTRDEGMPLIRIRDVGSDSSDTYYAGDYDSAFIVKAGDLLIGMDGDFNCARWRGPDGLLNQRVCRVILKSDIYHPKLLDYALPGYLKAINDMTSSVTVKHLSSKSIAEIPLPLPPMDQQKRIVAEIEKQFSRLDEAVANLKRVKANLKRYKAAVLKAAVEGRLVETEAELARREGRSYESGAQLLQRILETRRIQWQGNGKYKEPAAPDTTDLPELPEGWVWATADQLAEKITDGEHISPDLLPSGTPLLSAKDVRDFGVLFEDAKYVSPNDAIRFRGRCDPDRGDILIVSRGATVGRACRVNVDQNFCLMGSVILMKLHKLLESNYVLFALKAGFFLTRLTAVSGSTAQQAIYIRDIRPLPLPLPPFAEQQQIVAEVDRRLSLIREVESQADVNLKRTERLRQSILLCTFSGRLAKDGVDGLDKSIVEMQEAGVIL